MTECPLSFRWALSRCPPLDFIILSIFPLTAAEAKVHCSPKELSSDFSMAEGATGASCRLKVQLETRSGMKPPLKGSI